MVSAPEIVERWPSEAPLLARTEADVPFAGAVTIVVEGEIEVSNWEAFRELVGATGTEGAVAVVVDLSSVSFFDSCAIRGLLAARVTLETVGVPLYIDRASAIVERVLEVTGTRDYFPRSDDVG